MDNFCDNLIRIFGTICIIYLAKWLYIVIDWASFNVSDNVIEDLPASVCSLSHLKSLGLDNNDVKQVVFCDVKNFSNAMLDLIECYFSIMSQKQFMGNFQL